MVSIKLEPARNGVIKRIDDNNHGGAKEHRATVDVYESSDKDYISKFFYELSEDLGLHLGGKFEKEVLSFRKEWGSHYEPTKKELTRKIKETEAELTMLKELWNTISEI